MQEPQFHLHDLPFGRSIGRVDRNRGHCSLFCFVISLTHKKSDDTFFFQQRLMRFLTVCFETTKTGPNGLFFRISCHKACALEVKHPERWLVQTMRHAILVGHY